MAWFRIAIDTLSFARAKYIESVVDKHCICFGRGTYSASVWAVQLSGGTIQMSEGYGGSDVP